MTSGQGEPAPAVRPMQRLLALVEVLAILLGANALARVVLAATGVGGRGPALPRTPDEPFDWLGTGLSMAVRWGIALSMAFAVCRLRRSGGLAAYGLTLAGRPLSSHLKLGLLTAAVSFLPAAHKRASRAALARKARYSPSRCSSPSPTSSISTAPCWGAAWWWCFSGRPSSMGWPG